MDGGEQPKSLATACPNCGSAETRRDVALHRRPNLFMVLFFGWPFLLIRGAFSRAQAHCIDCKQGFRYKTVGSWVALAVLIAIILLVALSIYAESQMYD